MSVADVLSYNFNELIIARRCRVYVVVRGMHAVESSHRPSPL
jgi:hypothetical protein